MSATIQFDDVCWIGWWLMYSKRFQAPVWLLSLLQACTCHIQDYASVWSILLTVLLSRSLCHVPLDKVQCALQLTKKSAFLHWHMCEAFWSLATQAGIWSMLIKLWLNLSFCARISNAAQALENHRFCVRWQGFGWQAKWLGWQRTRTKMLVNFGLQRIKKPGDFGVDIWWYL